MTLTQLRGTLEATQTRTEVLAMTIAKSLAPFLGISVGKSLGGGR